MSMTTERRDELEELYVDEVVENMDMKTLRAFARDNISGGLQDCGDIELLEHIGGMYDHLLSPAELLESGVNHATD